MLHRCCERVQGVKPSIGANGRALVVVLVLHKIRYSLCLLQAQRAGRKRFAGAELLSMYLGSEVPASRFMSDLCFSRLRSDWLAISGFRAARLLQRQLPSLLHSPILKTQKPCLPRPGHFWTQTPLDRCYAAANIADRDRARRQVPSSKESRECARELQ